MTNAFDYEITGFGDLIKKLRSAANIFDKHQEIALKRSLALVQKIAKQHAPVHGGHRSFLGQTSLRAGQQGGTLRRSIIVEDLKRIGTHAWEGKVGPTVDYGKWVELGTSKMVARSFLLKALEDAQPEITKIFRQAYMEASKELKNL